MTDKTPSPSPATKRNALVHVPHTIKPLARRSAWRTVLLAIVTAGLVLAIGAWLGHQQLQIVRAQWSVQLAQHQATMAQVQAQAQHALDALQIQTTQLTTLQTEQAHTATQLQHLAQNLAQATQALSAVAPDSTDHPAMLMGEIHRLVQIAQQSVQLSSNIDTALVALESAQARLHGRSEWTELHRALQEDIVHLHALPVVDIVLLAAQLDDLSTLVAQAPLLPETIPATPAMQNRMTAQVEPERMVLALPDIQTSWWQTAWHQTRQWSRQAWHAIAQDVRSLIRVRRMDDATALLLSPEQAAQLRDLLQHRIAAARLALLMREPTIWIAQLDAVRNALDTRFDSHHPPVQQAKTLVRTLRDSAIRVPPLTLDESTRALAAQRSIWSERPPEAAPDTSAEPVASGSVQN